MTAQIACALHALLVPVALAGALAAGVVDARTGYIPDRITAPTALAGLLLALAAGVAASALAGGLIAGGALLALYLLSAGRGLGLGDVKLGAVIGIGLGPTSGAAALGAAFVGGGAYATWLLAARRARRGDSVRFGPFLAGGALLAAVTGLGR